MVKALVERLENDTVKLEIEVDAQTFESAVEQSYLKHRGDFAIPGFRKGKAPRKIIERYYGSGMFYEDAFETLFPKAYTKAVADNGLKPAGEPTAIDIQQISSGQDLKFTVKLQVAPTPVLGDYKGIEIRRIPDVVNDQDVDSELAKLREQHSRLLTKEDAAAYGDRINISMDCTIDGEIVELMTIRNKTFILNNDSELPEVDMHFVGMRAGEQKTIEAKLPDNFRLQEYAGKEATFEVTMNEVKIRELPELDDEFAKDISEFDTLNDYIEDLKSKLQKEKSSVAENGMKAQMLQMVSKNASVVIPDSMLENRVSSMIDQSDKRSKAMFGKTLAELDEIKYISLEDLKIRYKEDAYEDIKIELVLDEIAAMEGIIAADEEIEKSLPDNFPDTWKSGNVEDIREIDMLQTVKEAIIRRKTIDFLMDHAIITEQENAETQEEPVE